MHGLIISRCDSQPDTCVLRVSAKPLCILCMSDTCGHTQVQIFRTLEKLSYCLPEILSWERKICHNCPGSSGRQQLVVLVCSILILWEVVMTSTFLMSVPCTLTSWIGHTQRLILTILLEFSNSTSYFIG